MPEGMKLDLRICRLESGELLLGQFAPGDTKHTFKMMDPMHVSVVPDKMNRNAEAKIIVQRAILLGHYVTESNFIQICADRVVYWFPKPIDVALQVLWFRESGRAVPKELEVIQNTDMRIVDTSGKPIRTR